MADFDRPISIALMALGGQGGGVLTGWIVETAQTNGYLAQSTYIAGVAQRTGATVYCVEVFPKDRIGASGKLPVFTPYPVPGDVDLVIAGEMAETGRAILKGFVTPNATTLIASSHRVYSINEKSAHDDGIVDQSKVAEVAAQVARQFICFDMQEAAERTGSVISSVLLGAIAASGALPFSRDAFEQTIRDTGRAVDANLRGFAAGFDGIAATAESENEREPEKAVPAGPNGRALADRIAAELPAAIQRIVLHGALRCLDYQDAEYANEYIDTLVEVAAQDTAEHGYALSNEIARQLALQMCYEDVARVAELKTRGSRSERVREHVAAEPGQPVHVIEYFHPRLEELADCMPAGLGAWIERSTIARKLFSPFFGKGRNITTTNISGFLMLRVIASLRAIRRSSYRFQRQRALIREWLDHVQLLGTERYDDALAVARAIESVRGYGDTWQRGFDRYQEAP